MEGIWIGKWITRQYELYKAGELTHEQRGMLEKLPLEQLDKSLHDVQWGNVYSEAKRYY